MVDKSHDISNVFLDADWEHVRLISKLKTQFDHWNKKMDELNKEYNLSIAVQGRVMGSYDHAFFRSPLPEQELVQLKLKFENHLLNLASMKNNYTSHILFLEYHLNEQEQIYKTINNDFFKVRDDVKFTTSTHAKIFNVISKFEDLLGKYENNTKNTLKAYTSTQDLHNVSMDWLTTQESIMDCIKFYKQIHEYKPGTLPMVSSYELDLPINPRKLKQFNEDVELQVGRITGSWGSRTRNQPGPSKKMKTGGEGGMGN
jgi:hypothetical protein